MILDIWLSLNKSVMQRIQKRLGQAGTRLVLFDWQRGLYRGTSERPSFYRGLLMPIYKYKSIFTKHEGNKFTLGG